MIIDLIDTLWYTITIRREYKKNLLTQKNRIITYLGKCQVIRRVTPVIAGDGTDTG